MSKRIALVRRTASTGAMRILVTSATIAFYHLITFIHYFEKGGIMPVQPSEKEEEYFARLELERRKKIEEEKRAKIAEAEKQRLKELHYMRCPKCGSELQEIDYKGIKIDKCFTCEGLWLDAGELDQVAKLEKTSLDKLFSVFKR